jgi:hypothetical protein
VTALRDDPIGKINGPAAIMVPAVLIKKSVNSNCRPWNAAFSGNDLLPIGAWRFCQTGAPDFDRPCVGSEPRFGCHGRSAGDLRQLASD